MERFGVTPGEVPANADARLRSTLPPIDRFEDLLDVAWDALEGRTGASPRLRDALELLELIPRAGDRNAEAPVLDDDALASLVGRIRELPQIRAAAPSTIPRERSVPLLVAAAWVANGDPRTTDRFVGTLLDQLCGFAAFGIVFRAAEAALRGVGEVAFFRAVSGTLLDAGITAPSLEPIGLRPVPCPVRWPPDAEADLGSLNAERLWDWHCTAEVVLTIREINRRYGFPPVPPTYSIGAVTPPAACAGDLVTISGGGFGVGGGSVVFPRRPDETGESSVEVIAESWSDTEVAARVPPEAGCGPLSLRIVEATFAACDAFIDIHRSGTGTVSFVGGPPVIFEFEVNGAIESSVDAGTELTLSWRVCGAQSIRLRRTSEAGPELDVTDPAAESYPLGPAPEPADLVYELAATNGCGTESATVTVHVCRLGLQLATVGLEPDTDVIVTPASGPMAVTVPRGRDLVLMATAENRCGVHWVRIEGEMVRFCVQERGDLGQAQFGHYGDVATASLGSTSVSGDVTVHIATLASSCPDGYRLTGLSGSFFAVGEDARGRRATTAVLEVLVSV